MIANPITGSNKSVDLIEPTTRQTCLFISTGLLVSSNKQVKRTHPSSGWPEFFLKKLLSTPRLFDQTAEQALLDLISKMELMNYSTAFSGIDSPGTAFAQLRAAASHHAAKAIHDPAHLHAVDT